MTGHIGTNTPKFVPPRWDDRALILLKRGCANSVVGLELADPNTRIKLPFGRCRGTGGCRSYTAACRVTVGPISSRIASLWHLRLQMGFATAEALAGFQLSF